MQGASPPAYGPGTVALKWRAFEADNLYAVGATAEPMVSHALVTPGALGWARLSHDACAPTRMVAATKGLGGKEAHTRSERAAHDYP